MPRDLRWRLGGAILFVVGSALAFGAAASAFMQNAPVALGFAIGAFVAMLAGAVAIRQAGKTVPARPLDPADRRRIVRMASWTVAMVVALPLAVVLGVTLLLSGSPAADSESPLGRGLQLLNAETSEPATPRELQGHASVVFLESGMPAVQIVLDESSREMVANHGAGPQWLAKDGETLVLLPDATILASPDGGVITQPSWAEADALRARLSADTTQ